MYGHAPWQGLPKKKQDAIYFMSTFGEAQCSQEGS